MKAGNVSQTKRKILVVDDYKLAASTLAIILRQATFETAVAYSGEEAIEIASSFAPDILLCDFVMGGMNGVEAAIKILNFQPNCKVLLLAVQSATMDIQEEARAKGFNFEVLTKPVPPPELIESISELLPPDRIPPKRLPLCFTSASLRRGA
jgi:CheY-like chemotaxis protein